MNKTSILFLVGAPLLICALLFAEPGHGWQYPPKAPPDAGPICAEPPPVTCLPMPPAPGPISACGPNFNWELGARGIVYSLTGKMDDDRFGVVDFFKDLNVTENPFMIEAYVSLRKAPKWALTYTLGLPQKIEGDGTTPVPFNFRDALFAAGERISTEADLVLHRVEASYYLVVGCRHRFGPYGFAELISGKLEAVSPARSADSAGIGGYFGLGGDFEYALQDNIFMRARAAYIFLETAQQWAARADSDKVNNAGGILADLELKYFPGSGCGPAIPGFGAPGSRMYIGAGVNYRGIYSNLDDFRRVTGSAVGPYLEAGVIF